MKIVSLGVENIKRVVALLIEPNGNLVQITGKNGNGKTSTLDAIWWALAGKRPIQKKPIRDGADAASIVLVLGDPSSDDPKKRRELTITRTFELEDDGDYTTSIKVKNADGWTPQGGGQELLNSMIGALSFDPLAFAGMDADAQFEALKRFVPGFDFTANAGAREVAYDRRTDVNKLAKDAASAAAMITVPKDTPEAPESEAALLDELQAANDANALIERRRLNREQHLQRVQDATRAAALNREQAADLRRQAAEMDTRAAIKEQEAAELQEQYNAAEELPDQKDVTAIRQRIDAAKQVNANVASLQTRKRHLATAKQYEDEADQLTARISELDQAKRDAIAKAHMPIDGLTLGNGVVLFNGNPFDQASDAERLRVSVAIAARMNSKLRVIRVRRGSDLDSDGMRLLAELADANDMQVWVERVDESGETGFVIEDGRVKGQVLPEKQPEQPRATARKAVPADQTPADTAPALSDEFALSAEPAAKQKRARRPWTGPGAPSGDA